MWLNPDISLIPSVAALTSFFIQNFPDIAWYPYWYLGNPFYYLIGPVVPCLLGLFRLLMLPAEFIEYGYLFLILGSIFIVGLGIYLLLREFGVRKRQAFISGLLFIVLPFSYLLLYYQNGLKHIAFVFVPFVVIFYYRFLQKKQLRYVFLLVFFISVALLTTVSIFTSIIIAFIVLLIVVNPHNNKGKGESQASILQIDVGDYDKYIIQTIIIFFIAFCVSSIWYTPNYWWVLLTNPSFGGIPLFQLLIKIWNLLLTVVPVAFAFWVVKWRHIKLKGYLLFVFLFFNAFLFLTIIRFLSDPDFIIDWTGYGVELQFAGAILIGTGLFKWGKSGIKSQISNVKAQTLNVKYQNYKLLINRYALVIIIFILLCLDCYILLFGFALNGTGEYQKQIKSLLSPVVKGERVFLSGSDVFFINSLLQVQQVRGDNDNTSIHPMWAHGAYQIREGEDKNLTKYWLQILGAQYILVHTEKSKDPFHDFKNTRKYENYQRIKANNGDVLYKVPNSYIARIADIDLLQVKKPINGADAKQLRAYALTLKKPVPITFENNNQIKIIADSIPENSLISLAVTYDPNWKITVGQGKLGKDAFGNMVIVPQKSGKNNFIIQYKINILPRIVPLLIAVVLIIFLLRFELFYPRISKRFPKLHLGLHDEENDY